MTPLNHGVNVVQFIFTLQINYTNGSKITLNGSFFPFFGYFVDYIVLFGLDWGACGAMLCLCIPLFMGLSESVLKDTNGFT